MATFLYIWVWENLANPPALEARDCRFKSYHLDLCRSYRDVAQLVEFLLWEQVVARSNRVIPIMAVQLEGRANPSYGLG